MEKKSFLNLRLLIGVLFLIAIIVLLTFRAFSAPVTWKITTNSSIIWVETDDSKITDEDLAKQIQLFDSELAAKLGRAVLPIALGNETAGVEGDIRVVLDSTSGIKKQGFSITVADGIVTVTASDKDGLFYGCRDVIQQLVVDGSVSAKSEAPAVLERAVSLDNGRKHFSVENIKTLIREMSWCKMNALALHFSEEMGLGIESKQYPWLAGRDGSLCVVKDVTEDTDVLSHDDVREIVNYAKLYHVEIIPSFDSPGHMNYIVKKFNEKCKSNAFSFTYGGQTYTAPAGTDIGNYFHYNNKTAIVQGSRNKAYSRGIDISNEYALAFTKSLIVEYATLFKELGCTKFDIGGDELLGWGTSLSTSVSKWKQLDHWKSYAQDRAKAEGKSNYSDAVAYDAFLYYMNDLNDLVRNLGYTSVRMWNDDALRESDTGWKKVVNLNDNIDIWYWTATADKDSSGQYNTVWTYATKDYQVYNILCNFNYYVLNNDYANKTGGYVMATPEKIYNFWNPFIFTTESTTLGSGKNTAATNPNVLGSGYGIWCDDPSMKTSAAVISEAVTSIRAHAAKAWDYDCNDSVTYSAFTARVNKLDNAPTNLPTAPNIQSLDLEDFEAALAEYQAMNPEEYSSKSFNAYKAAVEAAQALVDNPATTQDQLDAAVAKIAEAKSALQPPLDLTALNEAKKVFDNADKDLYTEQSYAAYQNAVESALSLAANEDTTQAMLNEAVAQIEQTRLALQLKNQNVGSVNPVEVVARGEYVRQGETVTLHITGSGSIGGVIIYNDLNEIMQITIRYPNGGEGGDIVLAQFVENAPGKRTYSVYIIDSKGAQSADSMTCQVICY